MSTQKPPATAADEERELDGSGDERLLALATEQGRIMVTFNVRANHHRMGSSRKVARRLPTHRRIDRAEFGLILRVIDHALSTRAEQPA